MKPPPQAATRDTSDAKNCEAPAVPDPIPFRLEKEADVRALFLVAGYTVTALWELPNPYWPKSQEYDGVRTPWWLALTQWGPISVGRRKRVLAIHWEASSLRGEVTTDEVTKADVYVHAWSIEKAVEYLVALRTGGGDWRFGDENAARKSERNRIAKRVQDAANASFQHCEKDYPSNVLDKVYIWLVGGAVEALDPVKR
jgi:hypothetical protein